MGGTSSSCSIQSLQENADPHLALVLFLAYGQATVSGVTPSPPVHVFSFYLAQAKNGDSSCGDMTRQFTRPTWWERHNFRMPAS